MEGSDALQNVHIGINTGGELHLKGHIQIHNQAIKVRPRKHVQLVHKVSVPGPKGPVEMWYFWWRLQGGPQSFNNCQDNQGVLDLSQQQELFW